MYWALRAMCCTPLKSFTLHTIYTWKSWFLFNYKPIFICIFSYLIASVISLYMYIYFDLDLYGIVINCIAIMCVNKRLIKFMNANVQYDLMCYNWWNRKSEWKLTVRKSANEYWAYAGFIWFWESRVFTMYTTIVYIVFTRCVRSCDIHRYSSCGLT